MKHFFSIRAIFRQKRILLFLTGALFLLWVVLSLTVPFPLFRSPYATVLYSREGELLGARIAADGQWRFPAHGNIPDKFAACLIAFEDKHFFVHPGVDPFALLRGAWLNLTHKKVVSGGSTLTMQLVRLSRGNQPRNLPEKWIEIWQALYLETLYSKQEILNLYASHAPFGGNVVGLEAAAWRYYGRGAGQLSWAESATLAILPNAPSLIHPGKNRELLLIKRNRLLKRLEQKGLINPAEYDLACMEPIPAAPLPLPAVAPHLLTRLENEHHTELIVTSLQARLQEQVQQTVNRYAASHRSNHIYNAAALIADVETGEILAYAGNVTESFAPVPSGQVDIITAPRSTGSLLKPILYAAMLKDGKILPGTLIPDIPLNINGFTPRNYNRDFQGAVPARTAIEKSLNVPLVRMLSEYGTGRFLALLKKTGMTTLPFPEEHYGATLILGGAEGTLWDMSGIYASLARVLNHYRPYNGRYRKGDIHALTLFPGQKEKYPILSPGDSRLTDQPLLSAAAIWFAFEAMSGLNRPEEEADWQQFKSMKKIAWKTGTSYGNRDAWAIGVTPRHVVGIWVGNASGEGRPGLTGVGEAAPILFDLFSRLPSSGWFDMPYDELVKVPVCRKSGCKAGVLCEPVDTAWIPASGNITPLCPYHRLVHLSEDERYRVNSSCEKIERIISVPWFVLPPAEEHYYRNYHTDYRPLPPVKPGCEQNPDRQFALIYPEQGMSLYLPKGFSGKREEFIFKAAHSRPDATLYWHIDRKYIGETTGDHQITCSPDPGKHLLTLIDDEGSRLLISFDVK